MPIESRKCKRILALAAAASITIALTSGVSYGRMREWTSTEMVFTPEVSQQIRDGYFSDCLVPGGQKIYLADWQWDTTQRTVVIAVQRPEGSWIPPDQETTDGTDPLDETAAPEESVPSEVTLEVDNPDVQCDAVVEEQRITLTLTKTDDVIDVTPVQIHVAWQGLEGTFLVDLLPETDSEEQEAPTDGMQALAIDSCGVIDPENPLTYIQVDPEATSLRFGQGGQTISFVRCSLDGGQNYIVLYDGGDLPLDDKPEEWDGLVLVDLAQTAVSKTSDVIVDVSAEGRIGSCTIRWQRKSQVEPLFLKMSNLPCPVSVRTVWGSAQIQLQVQKLGVDQQTGQLIYADSDAVTVISADGAVILRAGQQPEPGTYRLVIRWIWNTVCVESQTIHFVINTK